MRSPRLSRPSAKTSALLGCEHRQGSWHIYRNGAKSVGLIVSLGLSTACSDGLDIHACDPTCGAGPFFVISELTFVTASTDGIAPGFNLDGRVSDGEASNDCNTPDLINPAGEPGIDNKLASVLAQLGDDVLTSITAGFQQAINDGGFLFTVEEIAVGDRRHLVYRRATGQPQLGDDDRIVPGQTLALHAEPFLGVAKNVPENDGSGLSEPFDLAMRFDSEGRALAFTLLESRFEFERHADSSLTGIFGGGVSSQDAVDLVVGLLGGDESYRDAIAAIMPALADMIDPANGECGRFSLTVSYKAVPIKIASQ